MTTSYHPPLTSIQKVQQDVPDALQVIFLRRRWRESVSREEAVLVNMKVLLTNAHVNSKTGVLVSEALVLLAICLGVLDNLAAFMSKLPCVLEVDEVEVEGF